tara:strand:- start:10105 stop:10359 length:255 start_codon:yes stop_codon:yes gene_type:complete
MKHLEDLKTFLHEQIDGEDNFITQNYKQYLKDIKSVEDERKELKAFIEEKIEYYDNLSYTRNGFEMACKGGRDALKEVLKLITT